MISRRLLGYVAALVAGGAALFGVVALLSGDQVFILGGRRVGGASGIEAGARAPVFSAQTIDETPVSRTLDDYKGRVVILNIWATYCIPCRVEMPALEALHQEFKERGLSVVAVSVDSPGMESEIRKFASDYKLSFDILYDPSGKIQEVYKTVGVPETFVIGRDGIITRKEWGAINWASLPNRSLMAQLLGDVIVPAEGGVSGPTGYNP